MQNDPRNRNDYFTRPSTYYSDKKHDTKSQDSSKTQKKSVIPKIGLGTRYFENKRSTYIED